MKKYIKTLALVCVTALTFELTTPAITIKADNITPASDISDIQAPDIPGELENTHSVIEQENAVYSPAPTEPSTEISTEPATIIQETTVANVETTEPATENVTEETITEEQNG